MFDVKAHVGPRVKDARREQPNIDELRHTLPCEAVFLAAPLERSTPQVGHVVPTSSTSQVTASSRYQSLRLL
jgi:hypothetical protein